MRLPVLPHCSALRVCALPPDHPRSRVTFGGSYTATKNYKKKKSGKKKQIMRTRTKRNRRTKTTEGNDHIVGYGDAVRGRGLLRPGAVLSVPQKSPRAPGLRLPIRSTPQGGHRVTIGTCLKISILFFLWPYLYVLERNLGCTEALTLSFYYCLSFSPTHLFLLCLCVTYPISLSVYLLVSLLNPHSRTLAFPASDGKLKA